MAFQMQATVQKPTKTTDINQTLEVIAKETVDLATSLKNIQHDFRVFLILHSEQITQN